MEWWDLRDYRELPRLLYFHGFLLFAYFSNTVFYLCIVFRQFVSIYCRAGWEVHKSSERIETSFLAVELPNQKKSSPVITASQSTASSLQSIHLYFLTCLNGCFCSPLTCCICPSVILCCHHPVSRKPQHFCPDFEDGCCDPQHF